MKVFICILALAITVHGGLLPASGPAQHQVPTKVIKLIHQTVSNPHATLPTTPLKIVKVIHESAANAVNVQSPSKLVLIHKPTSYGPKSSPKILKVIHHSAPVPAAAPVNVKLLKLIHEYAPAHSAPASTASSSKILKVIKQQAGAPLPLLPPGAQNVKVFKVFREVGSGGDASASNGGGHSYANGYGHATPTSTLNVVKVLEKPKW